MQSVLLIWIPFYPVYSYFPDKIRNIPRVYDAHELFTEMKEVVSRPSIHAFVVMGRKKQQIPKFKHGYTVNQFIADEFKKQIWNVDYSVIRNLPT